jgi:TolB-like protein
MLIPEPVLSETKFSKEAVTSQLQKITNDPIFEGSEILKKFLNYIVDETLNEHANTLKEYTIAVNVLNKPANFKPQESCIVRIHAGRLRRALNYYYGENGLLDTIRISVPKGSYVPVFTENDDDLPARLISSRKSVVIGVAPFTYSPKNALRGSFADGLGAQLSKALMNLENFSVIAYYAMHNIFTKATEMRQIMASVGAQYLVTGEIQMLKNSLRIHMQMISMRSSQLVWSQMYERRFVSENLFDVQDDIVKSVIQELGELAI